MISPTFTRFLRHSACTWAALVFATSSAPAQTTLDVIGVTALRSRDSTLTGLGVIVAQPEGTSFTASIPTPTDNNDFEVRPTATGVNQPVIRFSYINSAGVRVDGMFPNTVGTESGHADQVASFFYGNDGMGVAPGIAHVDNYNANYFFNNLITNRTDFDARVVNQSFIFANASLATQQIVDQRYDNYVATHLNTVFVSGVGNNDASAPQPEPPSTAYNGIAVGAFGSASSSGPTQDGRSKPDITAPAVATSFSTPLVSGAAAILIQAGTRGDGGIGAAATAAVDARTIKALLLTGARKPADWMHTPTQPLDLRYGAGVLNVNDSYTVLTGGERPATTTTQATPVAPKTALPVPTGTFASEPFQFFNLTTITDPLVITMNSADHYFFTLGPAVSPYIFTATLTWNRQLNQTAINDLDFYLINRASTATPIAASISSVDNVEHIYVPSLAAGNYDLQVQKVSAGRVSQAETYALAVSVVPEPSGILLFVFAGSSILALIRLRGAGFSQS